jgi:hypothetical protein
VEWEKNLESDSALTDDTEEETAQSTLTLREKNAPTKTVQIKTNKHTNKNNLMVESIFKFIKVDVQQEMSSPKNINIIF